MDNGQLINKQSRKLPELRFPEFEKIIENSYNKYYFRDIFNFSIGKNIKQNEASPDFDIPCVRYGELYHLYNEVINEVINKTNLKKTELLFSQGDEILLPSAGEDPLDIGSASALTIENVAIGRTINILKPLKSHVYSQIYVAYYINQRLKKRISKLAKGVSISNVYNSDLKTLSIILPSLPEQQKIATFFTAIDQKISQLKKKRDLLEQYKKGVMQKIFSQQIRFKDEDGREFPDWEEKRLGDFLVHKTLRNKNNKTTLVLSVSNTRGFIAQSDQFDNHRVASVDVSNYKIVIQNDFAYNPSRINVGSIARLTNYSEGIVSPMYVVFGFKQNLDAGYFENLIKTHKFKFLVKTSCSGSVRDSLNFDDLCEFTFNFPSLPEQTKIANFLSAIDDKIHHTQKQVEKAEQWKKGLMQRMFV